MHGGRDRDRRMAELAQDRVLQVAVALALAAAPAVARDGDRSGDDRIELRQILERDLLGEAGAAGEAGGGLDLVVRDLVGIELPEPGRRRAVGTNTVMPRFSASIRTWRCGASGLTLMRLADRKGSTWKSWSAAG
jgi:hypothetical protein